MRRGSLSACSGRRMLAAIRRRTCCHSLVGVTNKQGCTRRTFVIHKRASHKKHATKPLRYVRHNITTADYVCRRGRRPDRIYKSRKYDTVRALHTRTIPRTAAEYLGCQHVGRFLFVPPGHDQLHALSTPIARRHHRWSIHESLGSATRENRETCQKRSAGGVGVRREEQPKRG